LENEGIRGSRVDHVAIGVKRLADAPDFLVGELGGIPAEGGPGPGYSWAQWEYAGGGRIEVLEPAGPPRGFLHRFLERQGPGVHHVTFKVKDLRAAADAARRFGFGPVGYNDLSPGWKEAFLHPREALGTVVQLAESDPQLSTEEWRSDFTFPPAPEPRGERARVVGLRLTVRSAERARRQWEALLGGTCTEEEAGLLVFRWPETPLRISVVVEHDREEGPLGVEVASAPNFDLPKGAHPVLGVRFLPVPPAIDGAAAW
jgi:methylmalonyl-CoA/ethylmalonyl-CoA epimerase